MWVKEALPKKMNEKGLLSFLVFNERKDESVWINLFIFLLLIFNKCFSVFGHSNFSLLPVLVFINK